MHGADECQVKIEWCCIWYHLSDLAVCYSAMYFYAQTRSFGEALSTCPLGYGCGNSSWYDMYIRILFYYKLLV